MHLASCLVYTYNGEQSYACYSVILLLLCVGESNSSSENEMGFDLFGGGGDEELVVKCVLFYLHV